MLSNQTGRPVEVVLAEGPRYPVEDLLDLEKGPEAQQVAQSRVRAASAPPACPSGLAPEDVLKRLRGKLVKCRNRKTRELFAKIAQGESFADAGARDDTLARAAQVIGNLEPDEDPAVLVQVLDASLRKFQDVDAGTYSHESNVQWAIDKIRRGQAKKRGERAQSKANDEGIRKLFPGLEENPVDVNFDVAGPQATTGPMSTWIVDTGGLYFVRTGPNSTDPYHRPIRGKSLLTGLKRQLRRFAVPHVSLQTLTRGGEIRDKSVTELLDQYGTDVDEVVIDFTAPASTFDEAADRFIRAPRWDKAQPSYSARVETWLAALAGPLAPVLFDWLACMDRLDRPNSGLVLVGSKLAGKTLLANGCARYFGAPAPCKLSDVLGQFQARIVRCPVVFTDEALPKSVSTADLRELITQQTFDYEQKFVDRSTIVGACRFIFATNDIGKMINTDGDRTAEAIESTRDRLLYIPVQNAAREYLESLDAAGQRLTVDEIARHIAWLVATRFSQIKPGVRCWVECKNLPILHDQISKLVLAAALDRLVSGASFGQFHLAPPVAQQVFAVRGGRLRFRKETLIELAARLVPKNERVDRAEINERVRTLTAQKGRLNGARAWEVDSEQVIAYGVTLGKEEDELRALLAGRVVKGAGVTGEDDESAAPAPAPPAEEVAA